MLKHPYETYLKMNAEKLPSDFYVYKAPRWTICQSYSRIHKDFRSFFFICIYLQTIWWWFLLILFLTEKKHISTKGMLCVLMQQYVARDKIHSLQRACWVNWEQIRCTLCGAHFNMVIFLRTMIHASSWYCALMQMHNSNHIHFLQDKTSPKNVVRMLEPSHLFPLLSQQQETTNEAVHHGHHDQGNKLRKKDMYVKCATKSSLLLLNLRYTFVCILERGHIIVRSVINASHC